MPTRRTGRSGLEIYQRPGRKTLYLRGTIRGRRVFESTGTSERGLAEEVRAKRENELFRADLHGTKAPVTFADAAMSYLDLEQRGRSTQINVAKLIRHFGPATLCATVDQAAIDAAGRAICPNAKPISRRRQVTTPARAVLNHAARRGWCDPPRFEAVKGGGRRTDWIFPDQAEAMVAAASDKFRPLLTFLFCTGARVDEAIALDWADVKLAHARAVFRATKNGDDRQVDLVPRAIVALAGLPAPEDGRRAGRVFLTPKGAPYRRTESGKSGAGGGQIKRAFAAARVGAGLMDHLTPHHCRHSWASWHYCRWRDLLRLKEDGGWRDLRMVLRYVKLAPATMAPEIAAFWGAPAAGMTNVVPVDEDFSVSA